LPRRLNRWIEDCLGFKNRIRPRVLELLFAEREKGPHHVYKVAIEAAPIPGSRAESSLEAEQCKNLRSIIGTVIVVTVAALAALMFGLFHGIGWQERLVMVVGAAAIAGGATYTFQRFLKGPGKSSTGEDGEV
jgi:hypothetical protein